MGRIEKTVFISYRRTNLPWALNIFHDLTLHGYDVFFDFESIPSGDFEQVILGNIRARAHFLVVLTPSALERCVSPDDWLRREIETALDEKRNIVPIFLEGFDFSDSSISKYLTGKLANIKKYHGQNVPAGFFDEAMDKIRNKFLNVPLDAVLRPVSATVQKEVKKQQVAAGEAIQVEEKELTAQVWFEKGVRLSDSSDDEIHCYTEAIRLNPDYSDAYFNRGIARDDKGDFDRAIRDYTEAIRLKPDGYDAYSNRGATYYAKGDLNDAIKDSTKAIRLKPDFAAAYYNRATARRQKKNYYAAIADYRKYLALGGGIRDGDQKEVEEFIRDLKKKIK